MVFDIINNIHFKVGLPYEIIRDTQHMDRSFTAQIRYEQEV